MNSYQAKKVAFVATLYYHIEAFHLPYIQLLREKGCEVHVYARPDHGKPAVENSGAVCHDIWFHRNPFRFDNLKALSDLTEAFKAEEFDMTHLHTPVAGFLGRIAAKRACIPAVIYTAHGFHFFKGAPWLNWLLYYPAERLAARLTDFLVTINREDFERSKGFSVRKETVFIPGVGLNTRDLIFEDGDLTRSDKRAGLGVKPEDVVILCAAELNANKNQLQLIQAVHKLLATRKNVVCLLAGTGEQEAGLIDYTKAHNLERHVRFLGFRRDIPELMAAADIVALVSKREGLPKVLMEAMAAGKPVVVTDVRGSRDMITDNLNGLLVPLYDAEATATALQKLVDSQELRFAMGHKSTILVEEYDIQKVLSKMQNLYDQALSIKELHDEDRGRPPH